MPNAESIAGRFRSFRERSGLSEQEAAGKMGISMSCLWDIESFDGELSACYSPEEVRSFCRVLGINPNELFGLPKVPPISAAELVVLIREQCRERGMTLEQFEDVVGWRLSEYMDTPSKLLEEISVDGLQWLCKELSVEWQRAIAD